MRFVLLVNQRFRMIRHNESKYVATMLVALMVCVSANQSAAENGSRAQVVYYQDTRVFRINTAMTTYVMGVTEQEQMQTLYWGARLPDSDHFGAAKAAPGMSAFDPPIATTPEEFVGWGGGLPLEPSLKITFPDGTRDVMLKYLSHAIHDNQLVIEMKDVA